MMLTESIIANLLISNSSSNLPALRSIEYLTSSAVTSAPLWNLTPLLNLKVYFFPSFDTSYELATAGTKLPSTSGLTKPSNTLNKTSLVPAATAKCGSRLSKSCCIPTTIDFFLSPDEEFSFDLPPVQQSLLTLTIIISFSC